MIEIGYRSVVLRLGLLYHYFSRDKEDDFMNVVEYARYQHTR